MDDIFPSGTPRLTKADAARLVDPISNDKKCRTWCESISNPIEIKLAVLTELRRGHDARRGILIKLMARLQRIEKTIIDQNIINYQKSRL